MGVPKFFRWISERYPKINQRFGCPPEPSTYQEYFVSDNLDDNKDSDINNNNDINESKNAPPGLTPPPDPLSTCTQPPEIDRLYLDMNGIIHGCSHNNSELINEQGVSGALANDDNSTSNKVKVSLDNDEIFRNTCYYLDRVIGDMIKPKELVYMAIDGVAPRAKLNQQRSRRYQSGKEGEIETNIYDAHMQKLQQEEQARAMQFDNYEDDDDDDVEHAFYNMANPNHKKRLQNKFSKQQENEEMEEQMMLDKTTMRPYDRSNLKFETKQEENHSIDEESANTEAFHSNEITPGTEFFQEFTAHLEHFVKYKLSTDPKWQKLTIILSGSNVPGEGEHKIMKFIREQKQTPNYNPNLRHCIMGQDGDLIMLGLATHEPNLVLFRERVIFQRLQLESQEHLASPIDAYMHNAHFEFMHLNVLRDYLAYEMETSNVVANSPWDIEHVVDDFVFMTFFVGNDFLPHMPALNISDNAFDILFHAYKECRKDWLNESKQKKPYLTNAGNIICGKRLEQFLTTLGGHEVEFYEQRKRKPIMPARPSKIAHQGKKQREKEAQQQRLKNKSNNKKYGDLGFDNTLPSEEAVASKEEFDRVAYREMLQGHSDKFQNTDNFIYEEELDDDDDDEITDLVTDSEDDDDDFTFEPVMTGRVNFRPIDTDPQESNQSGGFFLSTMSALVNSSISSFSPSSSNDERSNESSKMEFIFDDQDLKGRYYYDKFQFTPFDAEKHLALRKAYIEGLVWNLKYYYEGCVSWDWYYPYYYGPMLSDLVNLEEILENVSFEGKLGKPFTPFQQLMGCMPPSQAHLLPKPYRWLMTDPESPIIDFFPKSFVIDMNGKRWSWEAVILLPFIDAEKLLQAANTVDTKMLTAKEHARNSMKEAFVLRHEPNHKESIPALDDQKMFRAIENCTAKVIPFSESNFQYKQSEVAVLKPKLQPNVKYPLSGFGTLRDAPVQGLSRRQVGINIFGTRGRFLCATLVMENISPPLPPTDVFGSKLIGTCVYINYPYFIEAFVTAVSDEKMHIRGRAPPKYWNDAEALEWKMQRDGLLRRSVIGDALPGTGGVLIPPDQAITLSVRPLAGSVTLEDGTKAKTFAKFEFQVPLITTFWTPSHPDTRISALPAQLEKNPFNVALPINGAQPVKRSQNNTTTKGKKKGGLLFPPRATSNNSKNNLHGGGGGSSSSSSGGGGRRDRPSFPKPLTAVKARRNIHSTLSQHHYNPQFNRRSMAILTSTTERTTFRSFNVSHAVGANNHYPTSLARSEMRRQSATGLRSGSVRGRLLAAGVVASTMFFASGRPFGSIAHHLQQNMAHIQQYKPILDCEQYPSNNAGFDVDDNSLLFTDILGIRGGGHGDYLPFDTAHETTPPLEFEHGTTTLSFVFQGGIIVAVDSRASLGNFVGSKTVQKVLPINSHVLGTMAGGAADCSYWFRRIKSEAKLHELQEGKRMSVARSSRLMSNLLYEYRGYGLSVGTMIMGYDDNDNNAKNNSKPQLYYVDNSGAHIGGDVFSVGSGSTFALGILDTERRYDMTEEEAIMLGIKAIRHATFRDAFSGGFINVYLIKKDGWKKVFTEDLARTAEIMSAGGSEEEVSKLDNNANETTTTSSDGTDNEP